MGMSASQGRLLSLTARMSDLEFQAQNISNSKIRLSQQSEQVAQEYSDALSKQKLTVYAGVDSTGVSQYVNATANNLTGYNALTGADKQRFLKDSDGRVVTSSKVGNAYDSSNGKVITMDGVAVTAAQLQETYDSATAFVKAILGYSTKDEAETAGKTYDASKVTYYTNCYTGVESFMNGLGKTSNSSNTDTTLDYDSGESSYYNKVYSEIKESGGYNAVSDTELSSTDWLYGQLSKGNIFLYTDEDNDGEFVNVSWSSGDSTLQTKNDDSGTAKAEAEYEAKMAKIETKDKRYDLDLKNIDTQHSAIQTEVDSVKKVIDKNIDRSFKTFNA